MKMPVHKLHQPLQLLFMAQRPFGRYFPVGPVSYTHLDVYKRQLFQQPYCYMIWLFSSFIIRLYIDKVLIIPILSLIHISQKM